MWNIHLVWCAGWTSCGFLRSDQKNRMRSNSGSMSATLSLQPSGKIRNKPPCSCKIYQTHTGKNFKSSLNIIIYWKNKNVCCRGYLVILHQLQIYSPPPPRPSNGNIIWWFVLCRIAGHGLFQNTMSATTLKEQGKSKKTLEGEFLYKCIVFKNNCAPWKMKHDLT